MFIFWTIAGMQFICSEVTADFVHIMCEARDAHPPPTWNDPCHFLMLREKELRGGLEHDGRWKIITTAQQQHWRATTMYIFQHQKAFEDLSSRSVPQRSMTLLSHCETNSDLWKPHYQVVLGHAQKGVVRNPLQSPSKVWDKTEAEPGFTSPLPPSLTGCLLHQPVAVSQKALANLIFN